jgi:hypothetical protein
MSRTFWFSPVPPARTDIAQYCRRIVPHLDGLIDLEVIRPDNQTVGQGEQELISRPASGLTLRSLNASRVSIYNIGNNPLFHGQIFRLAKQHPGVVVLHDRSLQDLCHAFFDDAYTEDGVGSYQTAMSHWYGCAGREAARAVLAGEVPVSNLAQEFPLFEFALQGALGAVTPNPEVAAEIAERFPGMPVATLCLPYYIKAPSMQARPVLSADSPIRLVMFGYLNPNRRLCDFLRAWACSPWRERFELDLAGEMNNGPEVRAVMAETALDRQIRHHGFLPDDQLDALIGQAHLVLNLRNPTMGEASGSQMRIWANGAPSVVSDTGWYGLLPEGSALRISIEREHDDLLELLEALAAGRIDLPAIAQRGSECLASADPAAYAVRLAEWLDQESETMSMRWTEAALIEAVARNYALCTPSRFVPKFPDRLLS